jgi:hypothetical protein
MPEEIDRIFLNNRAPHAGYAMRGQREEEVSEAKARFFEALRERFRRNQ